MIYMDQNEEDEDDELILPVQKKQRTSAPQEQKENVVPSWRRSERLSVSAGPTYEEMDLDL
jgi:hypothetical protein